MKSLKAFAKRWLGPWIKLLIPVLPIETRKRVAIWFLRRPRRWGTYWLALELISDFRESDFSAYHKFLWKNHLFYAETYTAEERFKSANQRPAGRRFFEALRTQLDLLQVSANRILSVLECGCSLGYQLRLMETELFPNAKKLLGIDIDETAVAEGRDVLASLGSSVKLALGDIECLDDLLGSDKFDVVICTGALMYLDEGAATASVAKLLQHTKVILGVSGLAHPTTPNSQLEHSVFRLWDQSLIHDLERMVEAGGGRVLGVAWEVDEIVDDSTNYFVFATPVR